jgi:uncharacterized protein
MQRSRSGNNEEFLSFCTNDTQWIFLGDKTLEGKEAENNRVSQSATQV